MARKAIKQEHVSMIHEAFGDPPYPRSSGDTIVIDSDSTMTDEGYETNHRAMFGGCLVLNQYFSLPTSSSP